MVKIKAPMMSLNASGSLGGALVFSTWKGKPYVRGLVKPSNPRSGGQLGMRAMLSFLSHSWIDLSLENKTTWAAPAHAANISPFNFFVSYNMQRWRQMRGPATAYPAGDTWVPIAASQILTGGQRNVQIEFTISGEDQAWAVGIFRSTEEIIDVNWNNCITVVHGTEGETVTYTDAPLAAGTYHYRCLAFSFDGVIGEACADDTAIVS